MRQVLAVISALFSICVVIGQNNTSSPYSIFGIGEIEPSGFGATQGMGGLGLAIHSPFYLNPSNPASYSFLQKHSVILESGVFFKKNYSQTENYKDQFSDSNLKYFALAFAPGEKWRMSIGLRPYSSIGYKISSEQTFEGVEGTYAVEFTGTGGLNQFYISNSYRLTQNLSLGFNLSYLWGYTEQTEFLGLGQTLSYDINHSSATYLGGINFDYGLQYAAKIKGDWHFTLGMVFDHASKIQAEESRITYRTLVGIPVDTLSRSEEALTDIIFPHSGGLGLAIGKGNKLTIAADFYYQGWATVESWNNLTEDFENSYRYSLGAEYIPSPGGAVYFENVAIRLGTHFTQSNLKLKNNYINEYGFSMGLGLPIRRLGLGMANISYQYNSKGTILDNLIKENTHTFSISFSLMDLWFIKPKID